MIDAMVGLMVEAIAALQRLAGSEFTALELALRMFPLVLLLEMPMALLIFLGILRLSTRQTTQPPPLADYRPPVTFIVTCYSESEAALRSTILTLCEQLYPGEVEIIAVLDGAAQHPDSHDALLRIRRELLPRYPLRHLVVLPKWQRGGRVSSLNAGLDIARGEVVFAVDADTSFDNDMLRWMMPHFRDPAVVAVAGSLKVRNRVKSLVTRLQAVEYMLSIETSRIGLAEWNILNNISGAFGAFRADVLRQIGGWDTHTAEDLDITIRLKSLFKRYPHLRLGFEARAVGHTDVPHTWAGFFKQRLRWDGDLYFMYIRKHFPSLAGNAIGWRNFFGTILYNLFFQLVLPFVLLVYLIWAVMVLPGPQFLLIMMLVYLFYAVQTLFLFIVHLCLVSNDPGSDFRHLGLLPFFPVFAFIQRYWSAIAVLNEVLRRGHEETSMAPYWVLRGGRRFW